MIINLYYLLWVFLLLFEIQVYNSPEYILQLRHVQIMSKAERLELINLNPFKYFISLVALSLYNIFVLIGLFSTQWVFCLLILLVPCIFRGQTEKSIRINSIICQILILALLFNKFYLHDTVNLLTYFKQH